MYWLRISWSAWAASFALSVYGQQSGWQDNQVNATMCNWAALRAAQLKDTVYMDGGYLWWVPGMADGSYGAPTQDDNPLGLIYTLNFSTPFNASTNISSILQTISKAPNGGAANNFAPNYYDGAMLANNDEFFLYGGLLLRTDAYSPPSANEVLAYQASQYGREQSSFRPGFLNDQLPDDMTRYVTYGGAVSAPSENKAWYFGGYRSPSWGPIYYPTANDSINPINVSNTLITLDLGDQQHETWTNATLPNGTPSRANPALVWVPVGEQGILVALGGVTDPDYNNLNMTPINLAQNEHDSPGFMSNIDIYDIANDKWYQQPTIGAPPPLTLGCAVVAPAQDFSSYNIYHYGGYAGIDSSSTFNDDVSSGQAGHARAGHQCVMPYPDQMGETLSCLEGGILQVFNLTEGRWMDSYDPDNWNVYGVPEMIHLMIGGDYSGGATMTTPTPTGWATPELSKVFATPYATSKIATYYPYGSQGPGNSTRGASNGGGGGMPSWVAPVLGVVLGLVFVTAIVVGILLYRRRKFLKGNGGSDGSTDEHRHRIISWVHGQTNPNSAKAPTISTEEPSSYGDMENRSIQPMHGQGHSHQFSQPEMKMTEHYEMPNTQLVELGGGKHISFLAFEATRDSSFSTFKEANLSIDTPAPVELGSNSPHDRQMSYPSSPHSASSPTNPPSFFTGGPLSHEHTSTVSSSHASPPLSQPQPQLQPQQEERPDSPSLGGGGGSDSNSNIDTPAPLRRNINNNIVDGEHTRQPSNTTVSSVAETTSTTPPPPPPGFQAGPLSPAMPVSPPVTTGGIEPPGYVDVYDYLQPRTLGTATSSGSPLRRSVFRENEDDMGDVGGGAGGGSGGSGR
ncbi:hypothetical protein F4775DRAFT_586687 [Biscogniauxia sp. FL1348]|nr:hypothetical protein F4775DRAFT_586687 [Biscogniauxia sp. FL1348]